MITLPFEDIKVAISKAFDCWLYSQSHGFSLNLGGHDVEVTVVLHGDRLNCGIPGYNMSRDDEDDLRSWVPGHIQHGSKLGELAPERDGMVNVWLKGVSVMFNFHVILANA